MRLQTTLAHAHVWTIAPEPHVSPIGMDSSSKGLEYSEPGFSPKCASSEVNSLVTVTISVNGRGGPLSLVSLMTLFKQIIKRGDSPQPPLRRLISLTPSTLGRCVRSLERLSSICRPFL